MRLGELVNRGFTQANATDISQNARKTSIAAVPMSAFSFLAHADFGGAGFASAAARVSRDVVKASIWSASGHREHAGLLGFLLDQPPDALLQLEKRRLMFHGERSCRRQVDVDHLLDRCRPG